MPPRSFRSSLQVPFPGPTLHHEHPPPPPPQCGMEGGESTGRCISPLVQHLLTGYGVPGPAWCWCCRGEQGHVLAPRKAASQPDGEGRD